VTVGFERPVAVATAAKATTSAASSTYSFEAAPGSLLPMEQILAQLHYPPLRFTPTPDTAVPTTFAQEVATMSQPVVHPGFPGDSVPWIPSSLVVRSSAASARSKSWAPVSERGSPREPCIRVPPPRERRHGHGLSVRDVPSGPLSRAEDELGSREGVQALRRAVSSLSPTEPTEGTPPISARRVASRTLVLLPGIEVGPIEGERETAMERTPAEPGHPEEREDRLDRYLRGDLSADDRAPRGVEVREVGHPFGGADEVRSETLRACRPNDPVNEVGGDVGTTASLVTPRRRSSPGIPDSAMSRATWSRPTSWPAFFAATT
jgi:hypothetical protein